MAAGLGFKDFTTGEVLTAADVDGYLMQGVWVFASATARDAAVTSPQEGNFAYLKDTNVTTYYTGSAWANLDTTGMTNPMTTTGDIIYSSPGSTPVRLGIGTANQVLRVNSGGTAPEWAAPAGGGKILQVVYASTTTRTESSSTTFADTALTASITPTSSSSTILVFVSHNGAIKNAENSQNALFLRLVRGSTEIAFNGGIGYTNTASRNGVGSATIICNDSPATTSSTTYKTQIRTNVSGATVAVNDSNDFSSITLLEIGA